MLQNPSLGCISEQHKGLQKVEFYDFFGKNTTLGHLLDPVQLYEL
jgi:hypothetical protein